MLNLPHLASELILQISIHLNPESVRNLRLVCRQLNRKVHKNFIKTIPSCQYISLTDHDPIPWASSDLFAKQLDTLKLMPYTLSEELADMYEKRGFHNLTDLRQHLDHISTIEFKRLKGLRRIIVMPENHVSPSSWSTERLLRSEMARNHRLESRGLPPTHYDPLTVLSCLIDVLKFCGTADMIDTIEYCGLSKADVWPTRYQLFELPQLSRLIFVDTSETTPGQLGLQHELRLSVDHNMRSWVTPTTVRHYGNYARLPQFPLSRIQKTRIIIFSLRFYGKNPVIHPLRIPLDVRSVCQKAAEHFGELGEIANMWLRVEQIDGVSYDGKVYPIVGSKALDRRKVERRPREFARQRFEDFIHEHVSKAAFWRELHNDDEYCDIICSLG